MEGRGEIPDPRVGHGDRGGACANLLIIQRDEDTGDHSYIAAYDKETGKEVWWTQRHVEPAGPRRSSWQRRADRAGDQRQPVDVAYDPDTGKELWRGKGVESNAIHTPLVGHGLVIVTAGFPAKKVIAIRPGPGIRPGTNRVGILGHRLRRFAHPLRRRMSTW